MIVERGTYRLEVSPDGLRATLSSPAGRHWLTISLLAAFDRAGSVDETLEVQAPIQDGDDVVVRRRSTAWRDAGIRLRCSRDAVEIETWVEGAGALTDVHLLGGRSLLAGRANGLFPTGTSFRTLFSPNPGDPRRRVQSAAEPAVVGAAGDGSPGRGHWFFTPPPLFFAFSTEEVASPGDAAEWLGLGLVAPIEELRFVQASYVPADLAFHLVLEYEGHTAVDGRFEAPRLVLTPGAATAYDALTAHCDGARVPPAAVSKPRWWSEPLFCGWGAQCALGGSAPANATQANYDVFLETLERHGVVPGTVVIDDKWQAAYGTNLPDPAKWPDLRGWIEQRHARDQRVLLWWKAWDPEGVPRELCIRTPDGAPVAIDPTHPDGRRLVRDSVRHMLGPGGLAADGLKVDFTARLPTGHALSLHGDGWGISLLHDLLEVVYSAAKDARPDALVITQTPHPAFADVTDMVRLNDMLRLDDPGPVPADAVVDQMTYRAEIARAALPETLIDTDDWTIPDKRTWRAYLDRKPSLGVPSLYYADRLDLSGEQLDEDDYAALRDVWARWRERAA